MVRSGGATLMELIVVIAIIAILAAVAYPNFLHVKQSTHRSDAHGALLATQALVERYLAENNEANLSSGDMSTTELANYAAGSGTPVITQAGYYLITIVPDSTSYSINATAIANGTTTACSAVANPESLDQCADTDCWVISITDGQKGSTNSVGSVANASTTTCW